MTFGLSRAGEGYFRPDGQSIIFQAVPNCPPRSSTIPSPTRTATRSSRPRSTTMRRADGQHGQRALHLPVFPSRRQVDPVRLDPPESQHRRRAAQGPGLQPDRALPLGLSRAMDIFKADLDGKNLVRLTDAPGYDAEGSYSPDGKQIVFTSFRDGDAEIYIMDADGKNAAPDHARQGLRRRPVLLARRQADHLPQRPQGERPAPDLRQQHRGHGRARPDQQRIRQLGAVLAPRRPPHHLRDQPARPLRTTSST